MAIKFEKNVSGSNNPSIIFLPTTASETYTVGEALVLSSGKLTKCTGTTAPRYISAAYYVAPATGMKDIAVGTVLETDEYLAAKGTGDFSDVEPGDVLGIGTDGVTVVPSTAAGYFTVLEVLTDFVRGKFDQVTEWVVSAIASFTAITLTQTGGAGAGDTQYQTAAAVIAALPTTVVATLANGKTAIIPVTWADTDTYNPNIAADYTFTATWGTMPTGANNSGSVSAPTVEVTVAA